jgi:hypothetical protein
MSLHRKGAAEPCPKPGGRMDRAELKSALAPSENETLMLPGER